jgi:hypothetical protein
MDCSMHTHKLLRTCMQRRSYGGPRECRAAMCDRSRAALAVPPACPVLEALRNTEHRRMGVPRALA